MVVMTRLADTFRSELRKFHEEDTRDFEYVVQLLDNRAENLQFHTMDDEALSVQISRLDGYIRCEKGPQSRFLRLQEIGDEVLFLAGMFPSFLARVYRQGSVGLSFYMQQGQRSYLGAAAMADETRRKQVASLMEHMAEGFRPWVQTLIQVRARFDHEKRPLDERTLAAIKRETGVNYEAARIDALVERRPEVLLPQQEYGPKGFLLN